MSTKTANTELTTGIIPNIDGNWSLQVLRIPSLESLRSMTISGQVQGAFGSDHFGGDVDGPAGEFQIQQGSLDNDGAVTFRVVIDGKNYKFSGNIVAGDPLGMCGNVNAELAKEPFDDGSWSAQAQGGGEPVRVGQARAARSY